MVVSITSRWFKKRDWLEYRKCLVKCAMRGWTIARNAERIQRELNRVGLRLRITAKGGDAA